ncbi:hypothetical protein GGP85_003069 [Salinibacter ruber]|uniref:hypothetical protein n=1 Tax=Salinibacter ruber TaxID=146919 RepID=UPI0021693B85|nr:hypothetical protein [Salinibacter ruber]MCS3627541.1 hypothetical protein [Salinibacter ruber]MCS3827599.1 hypothetical protein [Salinibacter ruber]MCS4144449.1 hypothetical protein [Salinibacter ruber]
MRTNGTLVPETVTRAQFRAYDADFEVPSGTADGIEAQNASALTLKDPKAEPAPTPPRRVTGLRVVLDR